MNGNNPNFVPGYKGNYKQSQRQSQSFHTSQSTQTQETSVEGKRKDGEKGSQGGKKKQGAKKQGGGNSSTVYSSSRPNYIPVDKKEKDSNKGKGLENNAGNPNTTKNTNSGKGKKNKSASNSTEDAKTPSSQHQTGSSKRGGKSALAASNFPALPTRKSMGTMTNKEGEVDVSTQTQDSNIKDAKETNAETKEVPGKYTRYIPHSQQNLNEPRHNPSWPTQQTRKLEMVPKKVKNRSRKRRRIKTRAPPPFLLLLRS
jgi:hypothetical protein